MLQQQNKKKHAATTILQNNHSWNLSQDEHHPDDYYYYYTSTNEGTTSSKERLSEAWNIPDPSEMERRHSFRQGIREETLQHRRIHRHGGIVGGRNIVLVLQDRQTRGSKVCGHRSNYQLPLPSSSTTTTSGGGAVGGQPQRASVDNNPTSSFFSANNHNRNHSLQQPLPPPPTTTTTMDATTAFSFSTPSTTPPKTGVPHKNNTANTMNNNHDQDHRHPLRNNRNIPFVGSVTNEIRIFAEYCSVTRFHSSFFQHLGGTDELVNGQRPSSSEAVSTISIAFSCDSQTMASTHGDHTVKITSCGNGQLLQTLEGHPRTPWTVKYHPINAEILASGCLGHQVRLWNWTNAQCLHMIRLDFAIISLSFHPLGQVLAIANGTRLHFWSLEGLLQQETAATTTTSTPSHNQNNENEDIPDQQGEQSQAEQQVRGSSAQQQQQQHPSTTGQVPPLQQQQPQPQQRRGILTEIEQRHMLRCVHFPPDGKSIIVGGVNPNSDHPPSRGGAVRRTGAAGGVAGGMSFYLRLFDFDLNMALQPSSSSSLSSSSLSSSLSSSVLDSTTIPTSATTSTQWDGTNTASTSTTLGGYRRRVISNVSNFFAI